MKTIIEKIVKDEIRKILSENRESIKGIVGASLMPQLRTAVREEITHILGELLEQGSETVQRQVPIREDPHDASILTPAPDNSEIPGPDPGPSHNSNQSTGDCLPEPTSDSAPGRARAGRNPQSAMGMYLYCIADGGQEANLGNMGIEGNEVYAIPFGELSAIVHNCTAEPYHSDDQEKVKDWVLTHQKVVDAAWEKFGMIIPMGFDTIICGKGDEDPKKNMNQWIEADYDNLTLKMAKIRDKAEYGVQIFWETKTIAHKISDESSEIKKLQEEIKTKPKGIAYMYRQKLEELLKNEMSKRADQYFQEFYEAIKIYADDLRVEKTKKTEDEGRQMLLNLSCLLPKDQSEKLGEALEEIDNREGFSVRYTGPWPPYSFV